MLRLLLKMVMLLCMGFTLALLLSIGIGRTAPEVSTIAFFTQEFDGTDYWHLDILSGISFKDAYASNFFISILDNVKNVPLRHIITIIEDANMNRIYEVNLDTQEFSHIADYPLIAHYPILAGDYIFTIDFTSGSYDWTRTHIPSRESEFFLEDTYIISNRVSPDSRWMAGALGSGEHLFINLLDASTYRINGYCCISWSPDGRWYIATHGNRVNVSVLNADNGGYHPNLPHDFPARQPYWARDSQSILYQHEGQLNSISLLTGEIEDYSVTAENFWIACFSPNQRYILSSVSNQLSLLDTETGEEIWRLNHSFSGSPNCFWSEDSRYMSLHVVADTIDTSGRQARISSNWQRYFFIDTMSRNVMELYPRGLPTMPIYMHVSE